MTPPPLAVAAPDLSAAQRLLRAFGGFLGLLILACVGWGTVQFIAAASAPGRNLQEMLGYQTILTAPLAGVAGGLAGAVLGWLSPKGRLRWRIAAATLIFTLLGTAWAAYLWLTAK